MKGIYGIYRKPKLPVEVEFEMQKQNNDEPEPCEEPDWGGEPLIQKDSEAMPRLKAMMFEKAKANINEAQKKDKMYYDLKHTDPRVHLDVFCCV